MEELEQEPCVCIKAITVYFLLSKGCFVTDANLVIPNNETYINSACSDKCICLSDQLICNSNFECSPNAACRVRDDVRQCYCNDGYEGDGETCIPLYKDCYDAYEVFQRRIDGVTDFYRNWTSYRNGFGSLQHGSDFWLGNEQLYYLTNTNQRSYKLRIDIVTSGGTPKYDEYAAFRIDGEGSKYTMVDLGSQSGTTGNGLRFGANRQFSTYDDDNDACAKFDCAGKHRGAWWYNNEWCSRCSGIHCYHFQHSSGCIDHCTDANINGDYNGGNGENIFWGYVPYHCNLNSSEMKIRPIV